jgi:hypothetical protein
MWMGTTRGRECAAYREDIKRGWTLKNAWILDGCFDDWLIGRSCKVSPQSTHAFTV